MQLSEINALLPFLLRRENVARYEDGAVVMCDRRKYPFEKAFHRCHDVEDAARAIEDMVTQGGGPQYVGLYAMAMLAGQVADQDSVKQREAFQTARQRLVRTSRPIPAWRLLERHRDHVRRPG